MIASLLVYTTGIVLVLGGMAGCIGKYVFWGEHKANVSSRISEKKIDELLRASGIEVEEHREEARTKSSGVAKRKIEPKYI